MKLSTKVRYGVRAMIELALHYGSGPVLVDTIANRQEISRKYLENLLVVLKNAGLVRSIRGSKGGYVLAKSPHLITVEDIAVAIDGPVRLLDCIDEPDRCPRSTTCTTHDLWKELTEQLRSTMRKKTLQDLVDEAKEKMEQVYMYYI